MQQRHLPPFLRRVAVPVDVETNGTIAPTPEVVDAVDLFVVSPKVMPSAAQDSQLVSRCAPLAALLATGKAVLKYVARDVDDLDAIHDHLADLAVFRGETAKAPTVYVMPEGRNTDELARHTAAIADTVVEQGWRLTTRLHVLAWGDTRGH